MMLADLAIWPTGWTRLYNRGCVIFVSLKRQWHDTFQKVAIGIIGKQKMGPGLRGERKETVSMIGAFDRIDDLAPASMDDVHRRGDLSVAVKGRL
jgi:hypothetical protein